MPATLNKISPVRFIIGFGIVSALADMVYEGARSVSGRTSALWGRGPRRSA